MKDEMVTIKFSVNRMREGWDHGPQIIECEIKRPLDYGKQIDYHYDDHFNESVYNRFCSEAPRIVYAIHGYECGRDWYFENGPIVVR